MYKVDLSKCGLRDAIRLLKAAKKYISNCLNFTLP